MTEVRADPDAGLNPRRWPATLPCVAQLLRDGLQLGPVTVLVGENGSGKSTLTEAIAQAYGMSPEGGSTGSRYSTRPTESPLHRALQLTRGVGASRWGFFLRSETMHGFFTYRENNPAGPLRVDGLVRSEQYHQMSHGESFVELLSTHVDGPGLFILDEPESALSFTGCLALVDILHRMVGSSHQQAIVATHSPIIAATPGATILEVGDWGLAEREWADLDLVQNWSAFLRAPRMFLDPLLDEDDR